MTRFTVFSLPPGRVRKTKATFTGARKGKIITNREGMILQELAIVRLYLLNWFSYLCYCDGLSNWFSYLCYCDGLSDL